MEHLTDEKFAPRSQMALCCGKIRLKVLHHNRVYRGSKGYADRQEQHLSSCSMSTTQWRSTHSWSQQKSKGYNVLVMDGQLDSHYINYYESKNQETRFVRVDSDVVDKLIQKDDAVSIALNDHEQEILRPVFESQMPSDETINYQISFEGMSAERLTGNYHTE